MDRYQGRSGRLPFAATTEERYAPQKIASADGSPVLVAWLSSRQVNRGEPASIYAAILDGEAVVERVQAVVRGAGRPPEMVSLEAGTGAFSAAANVDAFVPRNGGAAAVNVDVVAEGRKDGVSFHRTVSLALFVQEPVARLNARDAHVDRRAGDLVVRADAKITSPGTYFVYAELWTQGDEAVPVAFSRQRLPLSVGRQPIELLFGGQIIRDRGLDGPYEVRHLELSRVESVPPETAAPVPLVATTPAWGANEFN